MVQNQVKLVDAHRAETLVKIYWLCRAEKVNHYKLLNYFFQILQISLLFVLFDEKKLKLTVQVSCLFCFSLADFFKEKIKSGFFGGFYYVFIKW